MKNGSATDCEIGSRCHTSGLRCPSLLYDVDFMFRTRCWLIVVALVLSGGCAKKSPSADRSPTPRVDATADPIDSLVADAGLAMKFDVADRDEIASALGNFVPDGGADLDGEEAFFGGEGLRRILDEPEALEALDDERPVYFAVTPRANSQFVNALELSRVLAVEEDPRWLHTRIVADAREGEAGRLREELEPIFEADSGPRTHWRLTTREGRVVADRLAILNPGIAGEIESGYGQLSGRSGLGRRRVSTARAKFAQSQAPVAAYGDVRRIGLVLAIQRAGTRGERFVAGLGDQRTGRLELTRRWVEENNAASDLFQQLHRRRGDFADVAIELSGDPGGRAVVTRTDASVRSDGDESPDTRVEDHPDGETILQLEAASSGERRRANRSVAHWLAEGDETVSADGLIDRFSTTEPWRIVQYPAEALSALFADAGTFRAPKALRFSVFEPGTFDGDDGSADGPSPVVVTASLPADRDDRAVRRALERRLGEEFDWELDDGSVRASRHVDLDEVFGDETATSSAETLSLTADGSRARQWRDEADGAALRVLPRELFALMEEDWQLSAEARETYTRLKFGPAEATSDQRKELPERAVAVENIPPSCALDARQAIGRLIEEFRNSRGRPDQTQTLVRRAMPIIDRARRCERDYPQLPRFSRVLGRQIWYLGVRDEGRGRLHQAREMYGQGCDFEEPVACQYLNRIGRAAAVEPPGTQLELRAGRPGSTFSAFVNAYVAIDEMDRVSVGHRSVGTVDELDEQRKRREVADRLESRPLPTPLGMIAGDDDLYRQARQTVGLVAPPDLEARSLLRSLTEQPLSDELSFVSYLRVPAGEDEDDEVSRLRSTLLDVERVGRLEDRSDGTDGQIRIRVGDDGIDIVADGRRLRPAAGCPADGPTVCRDFGDRQRRDAVPVEGLLEAMPRIPMWRRGIGEVVVVLDRELTWEALNEMTALVTDANHPAFDRPIFEWVPWFNPRFGVPYTEATVVFPDE